MSGVKLNHALGGSTTLEAGNTSSAETVTLPAGNNTLATETQFKAAGGRKNLIINGGFDVWQRGTSFSSSNADIFASDRWSINSIGATQRSVDKVFNTVTESSAMRIVLGSTGNLQIIQKIEGFKHLHNKPIAISFYAKSTGMTSIYVKLRVYHTGGSTEIESGVTTLTSTFSKKTILVNAKDLSSYTEDGSSSMRFELQTISGTSGDTIEITQVQLEVGSQATDFEHRSHGEELALCQRYYEKITWGACPTLDVGNTNRNYIPSHSVWMRTSPTVSLIGPSNGNSNETYEFSSGVIRSITHVSSATQFPGLSPYFQLSTGANRMQYVNAEFDAEL